MADEGAALLRELLIEVGVFGDDESIASLREIDDALDATRSAMDRVVTTAAGVIAAIGAIAAAGTATAVSAANSAEALLQQADALGVSVEELQRYDFAFQRVRGGSELLSQALFTLTGRAAEAAEGNEALAGTFATLGLGVSELRSQDPLALMGQLADGLANAEDQGRATSAVMRLLGEDVARRVAPLLIQGADGLRALRDEADALGVVTRRDVLTATAELATSWRELRAVGTALFEEVGQAIAPTVLRIAEAILTWVRANRGLISSGLANTVQGLVQLFVDWAPIVAAVSVAFAGLATVVAAAFAAPTIAAFAAANTTLVALGVTVAGLTGYVVALYVAWEDLNVFLRGGNSLIGALADQVQAFSPVLAELIRTMAQAAGFAQSLVGLALRAAVAYGEWAAVIFRVNAQMSPLVGFVRTLWELLNRTLDGSWLASLGSYLAAGSLAIDQIRFGAAASTSTTTTTTTNNRSDISQTVNVLGGDAEEAVAGALRAGRQAVSGGVR